MDCARRSSFRNPDSWVDHCPDFSRPICAQLRDWIIRWEPDLTESIKWNMLCFTGRKLVCGLSGCKRHAGFTFFRGMELSDATNLFDESENSTSIRTIRVRSLDELKPQALRKLLHAAVVLDDDPERPPLPPAKREPWPMPEILAKALKRHPAAARGFSALAPTYQREYLVWISTAKTDPTRDRRLKQTLVALTEGLKWGQRKRA